MLCNFFSIIIFFRCEKQELHLMQDELEDLRDCGIGACKPWFLSSLANIKVSFFMFKTQPGLNSEIKRLLFEHFSVNHE